MIIEWSKSKKKLTFAWKTSGYVLYIERRFILHKKNYVQHWDIIKDRYNAAKISWPNFTTTTKSHLLILVFWNWWRRNHPCKLLSYAYRLMELKGICTFTRACIWTVKMSRFKSIFRKIVCKCEFWFRWKDLIEYFAIEKCVVFDRLDHRDIIFKLKINLLQIHWDMQHTSVARLSI